MSLEDLYREVILDHYRNPRHHRRLESPDAEAEGQNPLCGDEVLVQLGFAGDSIAEVGITGQGCSISQASASMMGDAILGKDLEQVDSLTRKFKAMMSIDEGEEDPTDPDRPGAVLGDLEALQGVRKFPVRIKCADLPWTTLAEALDGRR